MSEILFHLGGETLLRDFPPGSLIPPDDVAEAARAAREGERKIDPLAALVRHALAAARSEAEESARRRGDRRRAA
jgi:hypothetical protein